MKKVFKKYKYIFLATSVILAAGVFNISSYKQASAGSEHDLSGWAWSENIGWISFNSTNQGGGANYGVDVAPNGDISGYAWSENIGWISFNETVGCPQAPCRPKMNRGTGEVSGWAKALAADGNGWNGWIHLKGSNYGVTASGCNWDGYAWGSDVVGWIHFQGANYGVTGTNEACTVPPFNYFLSNGGNRSVTQGQPVSNNLTATLTTEEVKIVTFSVSGLPSGTSGSFSPASCSPTCSTTLEISTSFSTPAGSYEINVTGAPLGKVTVFDLNVSATQCSNEIDNDGDTLIDLADPGCSDPTDDDEANPPNPEGFSCAADNQCQSDLECKEETCQLKQPIFKEVSPE